MAANPRSSFLALPPPVRFRIYMYSDLIHGCPLELVRKPRTREPLGLRSGSCESTLERGVTSGFVCTYIAYKAGNVPVYNNEEDFICLGLPPSLSLLRACRTVHREASKVFYSMNQFKLSPSTPDELRIALRGINPLALARMKSFHIDLTDLVFEMLIKDSPLAFEFIDALQSSCGSLSSIISYGQLWNFSFVTSARDPDVLRSFVSCLDCLPPAKSTAISLGPEPAMRELARSASTRLSTTQLSLTTKAFPFLSLPQEISLQILGFISLVSRAPSGLLSFSFGIISEREICCIACTSACHPCCCLTNPAAWSPSCKCALDFRPLFLVCRRMRDEAYYVLGSQNIWSFELLCSNTSKLLRSIPVGITRAIRRIQLLINESTLKDWTTDTFDQPAQSGQAYETWKNILQTIKHVVNVENLALEIDIGTKEISFWRDKIDNETIGILLNGQLAVGPYIGKELGRPKKLWIRGLLGDNIDEEIEKSVMGEKYNSIAEGKDSFSS